VKLAAGLRDRSDQELAEDEEHATSDDRLVAVVQPETWSVLRATRYNGRPAAVWVLEQLELKGAKGFHDAVAEVEFHAAQLDRRQRGRSPP
jgi:hypothetical protein